jgi:hypothetical protein
MITTQPNRCATPHCNLISIADEFCVACRDYPEAETTLSEQPKKQSIVADRYGMTDDEVLANLTKFQRLHITRPTTHTDLMTHALRAEAKLRGLPVG